MPKLTDEQLNALKELPYWDKIKDMTNLYEVGILSQEKFNDELLIARKNIRPVPMKLGIEMVFVQGGTFIMGDEVGDLYDSDRPVHSVYLDDFFICRYVVTQAQYFLVTGENPSMYNNDNKNPLDNITWYKAISFCNKLSEIEALEKCYTETAADGIMCDFKANGYRLPTEAEWEYSARGGKYSKKFMYSGSNYPDEVAWYDQNSKKQTQPVGTKQPNELGIYDMSGNVWEWCWDRKDIYRSGSQSNPKGSMDALYRVSRGGCYCNHTANIRCAARNSKLPYESGYGFRLARTKN